MPGNYEHVSPEAGVRQNMVSSLSISGLTPSKQHMAICLIMTDATVGSIHATA